MKAVAAWNPPGPSTKKISSASRAVWLCHGALRTTLFLFPIVPMEKSFTNAEWQEQCGKFVSLHIEHCQSSLVDDLLREGRYDFSDITNYKEDKEGSFPEIYEWWLCDDWLLDKLEAKGECILRNEHGDWWGRQCTGQAIKMDSVIEDIVKEIL